MSQVSGFESEDGAGGLASVGFGVNVDGRERGRGQGAVLDVVESDDGQVAGLAAGPAAQVRPPAQSGRQPRSR